MWQLKVSWPPGAAGAGGWSLSSTPSLGWLGRHLPSAVRQLSQSRLKATSSSYIGVQLRNCQT